MQQALSDLLSRLPRKRTHREDIPILPGELPVVGHAPFLLGDALGYLRRAEARMGPLFWMKGVGRDYSLV